MSAVLSFTTTLLSNVCANCGVQFAMPKQLEASLRESKATFYCPSGHELSYRESRADRLERELASAQKNALVAQEEASAARVRAADAEEARRVSEKKLARVKNGVCPCCRRSFSALEKHMKKQHPQFAARQTGRKVP